MDKRRCWVARKDMTLAGKKVYIGQLIEPTNAVHDRLIFQDDSSWARRYDGEGSYICGTDGCSCEFERESDLFRHRRLAHAVERDDRERAKVERSEQARRAEESGATIGGYRVTKEKKGPRGSVPYIELPVGQ